MKAVGHRLARMLVAAEPAPLWLARRHVTGASAMSQPLAFALLLGMAPIVAVVARRSLGLLPILALPVAAVWLAGHGALRAQRERARAEAVAERARSFAAEQARLVQGEQALIRRLQESERLKQDLLAVVSHELKTPLTVILGTLCTLATREAALAPAEREEFVGMAVRHGTRLKELIEQLLEAARLEQPGQEPAARSLTDAAAALHEAGLAARICHPDRPIEIAAGGPLQVRAAPGVIAQVLGNLVDNAAKYSPDGAVICLRAGRVGGLAVLAVEDQGPGVPAAQRERIFERFTQLDSGATRRAGGVGLGLYIARQLAQAQGGELLLAEGAGEPQGGGARFELRLPLAVLPGGPWAFTSDPATVSDLSWRSPASTR